jgi:predicted Zn-dependent protease
VRWDSKGAQTLNVESQICSPFPQDALPALETLATQASQEANVVYLLAKLYRLTGQKEKSTIAFAHARDLNPKLSGAIKSFTEGQDRADEESGDEGKTDADEGLTAAE